MADTPRYLQLRPWSALCQFPGLDQFWFGTAWTARTEGEETARVEITWALARTFPTTPDIVSLHPGQVVFAPDPQDPPE